MQYNSCSMHAERLGINLKSFSTWSPKNVDKLEKTVLLQYFLRVVDEKYFDEGPKRGVKHYPTKVILTHKA